MRFYLGTHKTQWLGFPQFENVPLFISHRTLSVRKRMPRAVTRWALDSGGYSELTMFGEWRTSPGEYIDAVHRYSEEIGQLDWAAPQDWMTEPWVLEKTGRSLQEHQELTVENFLDLRLSGLPFIPVLQGQTLDDYLAHVEMYESAGFYLSAFDTVGVGSVCRRQGTRDAEQIFQALAALGIRCHGFGVKTSGLRRYHHLVESADSMAWSFGARYEPPLPGHTHKACNNCPTYALDWRTRVLAAVPNYEETA